MPPQRTSALRITLAFSLAALAAGSAQAAPVFFVDGAAHAIPGDPAFVDDDWIILNGGSTLEVTGTARVAGEPMTAIDVAFGGDALVSAAGTGVRIAGGSIVGGTATGLLDLASPVAGVVSFGGYAIDAGGAFEMHAGAVLGGAAETTVDPTIERASAISGAGLQLAAATATITDGIVSSGPANASGGSLENEAVTADALIVGSASILRLRGAAIAAGEARVQNDLQVEGDALATGGDAVSVREGATVVIESSGVSLTGGDAIAASGIVTGFARSVPGSALAIEDGSRVTIHGGDFGVGIGATASANASSFEIVPAPAIDVAITGAAQPARLTLLGGRFRGASSLRVAFSTAVPADARIEILGGDLDSAGSVDLALAHPFVTTTLYGFAIALDGVPLASGPVIATTGTLSGTLQTGAPFAWTFVRENDAPLEIRVPEATVGLWPGLMLLAGLARRRTGSPR